MWKGLLVYNLCNIGIIIINVGKGLKEVSNVKEVDSTVQGRASGVTTRIGQQVFSIF